METEYDNVPSLALYEALGFVREKRLHRFYSNGKDAYVVCCRRSLTNTGTDLFFLLEHTRWSRPLRRPSVAVSSFPRAQATTCRPRLPLSLPVRTIAQTTSRG